MSTFSLHPLDVFYASFYWKKTIFPFWFSWLYLTWCSSLRIRLREKIKRRVLNKKRIVVKYEREKTVWLTCFKQGNEWKLISKRSRKWGIQKMSMLLNYSCCPFLDIVFKMFCLIMPIIWCLKQKRDAISKIIITICDVKSKYYYLHIIFDEDTGWANQLYLNEKLIRLDVFKTLIHSSSPNIHLC